MTSLKPEIIQILQREEAICEAALFRLHEKTRLLENQYGWPTATFLRMFDSGRVGDDQDFFRWYALAEALQDWQKTLDSLQEMLASADVVYA